MIYTILAVLIPLILTIILELIIWFFVIKKFDNTRPYFWLLIIAVNFATNPLLNLIFYFFDPLRSLWFLEIILELVVVLVEALIFYLVYRKDFPKLLIISLILNFCSYFLGLLIFTPSWL